MLADNSAEEIVAGQHIEDETSPLLEPTVTPTTLTWRSLLGRYTVVLCIVLVLILEIGVFLSFAPINKLVEELICRQHFPDLEDPSDPRCKSTSVQSYFALLNGWNGTLDCIPGE
jgi:hypothetical protein